MVHRASRPRRSIPRAACTAPITNPSTGGVVSPALLQPGSELEWHGSPAPNHCAMRWNRSDTSSSDDPKWDWHAFSLARDLPRALQADAWHHRLHGSESIEPFFHRGGKLLMYHGWADPQVTPLNTIGLLQRDPQSAGGSGRAKSVELVHGAGHEPCWGGEGPDTFDVVGALERWVQTGKAPGRISRSIRRMRQSTARGRLCPIRRSRSYKRHGQYRVRQSNFRCESNAPRSAAKR